MSTFHRLMSRKDKNAHGAPHKKVMSPPTSHNLFPRPESTSSSSSFSTLNFHTRSSSVSSLSLAFSSAQNTKRSPRLQATQGTIEASTANAHEDLLLQPKQTAGFLHGLFPEEERKSPEKDENAKIRALSERLSNSGYHKFKESDISYVLNAPHANGDTEKAYDLMVLFQESEDGIIKPYDRNIKLLGAVNREGVTCYLDSLLFAMFARQSCFEAMLYNDFENIEKKKLATLIRLWVNILRVGKLITTDMTKQLQLQLAECGWTQASELAQQDASEAFSFITEILDLPLLTLKMDIFHNGKEEATDDHKFINERMLEVSIPEDSGDGSVITLEDCLETYFNNRIEIKRYLERRNTLGSFRSRSSVDHEKGSFSHVETLECDTSQPSTPLSPLQPSLKSPRKSTNSRTRAPSIIQESYISEKGELLDSPAYEESLLLPGRRRAGSVRKEVMMPAWQFFRLIPWYTDSQPMTDMQVANHFSSKRPMLGICLKRYTFLPNGTAVRRGTHIDIPSEIGLPHFISDDSLVETVSPFGNFKLSLQSVVCHRGNSVDSGHYVSIVRNSDPYTVENESWMRLDDLAKERVAEANIETFLKKETPYLLFYQVLPIDGDPGHITEADHPPAYSESSYQGHSLGGLSLDEKERSSSVAGSSDQPLESVDRPSVEQLDRRSSATSDLQPKTVFANASSGNITGETSVRNSFEINGVAPPSYQSPKRNGPATSDGPYIQPNDNRFSTSMSRLTGRLIKDKSDPSASAQTQSPNARPSLEIGEGPRLVDRSKLRKEKHKSKPAGHQHLTKNKPKTLKPDRECAIM